MIHILILCNLIWFSSCKEDDYKISSESLKILDEKINNQKYGRIHSLLINQNGGLIYEKYFNGIKENSIQPSQSITKSLTSILIGIAIDKGMINSLDDRISKYLPEYLDLFESDSLKKLITIRNSLMMTTGLKWNEERISANSDSNQVHIMNKQRDLILYALQQPMESLPGNFYNYNSGIAMALGKVIQNASNMEVEEFAEKFLFSLINIEEYDWYKPNGQTHTGGGFATTSRNLSKIGLLFRNNGKSDNTQVVSSQWLKQSIDTLVNIKEPFYRGLGWIVIKTEYDFDIIAASGFGGQAIFIVPEFDIVVTETAWNTGPDGVLISLDILKNILYSTESVKKKIINKYDNILNIEAKRLNDFGLDLFYSNEFQKAQEAFDISLNSNSNNHKTHYYIAKLNYEIDNYIKAKKHAELSIELNKKSGHNEKMDLIIAKEILDKVTR